MLIDQRLKTDGIELLKNLISSPSFSREEAATAALIEAHFKKAGIPFERKRNNIWASTESRHKGPVVLLNSHHDTIRPVNDWKRNPFKPSIENGKLYGLGSNDAGGALVALLTVFIHFYKMETLPFKLIFAATAEEEISGKNGIASILPDLGKIDFGLVGEPTKMQMAIAEKGLIVVDAEAKGRAGHAARNEGLNAIYIALADIAFLKEFDFEKKSDLLGPVKISVTQIEAGSQHNVVPDICRFVIDIRSNEYYQNKTVFDILNAKTKSELKARSYRLNSSYISENHPLVLSGKKMGLTSFGSPTLSDQAFMPFPTLKFGPGDSARSHTADEFIYLNEIEQGMETYAELLSKVCKK